MYSSLLKKVYLSLCGSHQATVREQLSSVLTRAGFEVEPLYSVYDEQSEAEIEQCLQNANCSIHILYPTFGPLFKNKESLAAHQLQLAGKKLTEDPDFKIIIWLAPGTDVLNLEEEQLKFIKEVRNNIAPRNMIFSNAKSAIHLVDDLRHIMEKREEVKFEIQPTEVFLVSNQLDEEESNNIIEILSDIVEVGNLKIIQDSDTDYAELCRQQIHQSRLAVIYFKESADWALPFTQQVWRKVGGAASHIPILLIGDEVPDSNMNKKFKAPKVISLIMSGELIPLEIKVQYDNVLELKTS